jgi:hypothetical protein
MKYSRINDGVIRQLVRCFVEDMPASVAARILGVNVKTVNVRYLSFRKALSRLPVAKSSFKRATQGTTLAQYWNRRRAKLYGFPAHLRNLHRIETLVRFTTPAHEIEKILLNDFETTE